MKLGDRVPVKLYFDVKFKWHMRHMICHYQGKYAGFRSPILDFVSRIFKSEPKIIYISEYYKMQHILWRISLYRIKTKRGFYILIF